LKALAQLSLKERVLAHARKIDTLRVYAPNGKYIGIKGELASIMRQTFDNLLRAAAEEAGARFLAPLWLQSPIVHKNRIAGAVFTTETGSTVRIGAGITLLATGAGAAPLRILGASTMQGPSAIAMRMYYQGSSDLVEELDHFAISYDASVRPGYGWLFPGPDGIFNLGVGLFYPTYRRPVNRNLHRLFSEFAKNFAPVRRLIARSQPITSLSGAPLRTSLKGSHLTRPGLLVIGEAAGTTYALSGEGIGKALESGLLASDAVLSGRAIEDEYARRMRETLRPRFDGYAAAQAWLSRPFLANLLVWRANSGRHVRETLEALLREDADPRALFSLLGLCNAVFR